MTRRFPRFLLYPLAAAVPVLGLTIGLSVAAGASTAVSAPSGVPSSSAAAAAAAKAAIKNLHIGQPATDHRVAGSAKTINGQTQVESTNWSGYADTGSSFSHVSASWTEPSASCSGGRGTEQLAAFWVGIDGYSSSSVEQDGSLIECYRGSAYHYTWWEMYPANAVQVVGSTAAAGDHITATVTGTGTSYTLTVTDSTNPSDSFSTTQTCTSCADSSAEWIAEAPSGSTSLYPLANFGTWTASNASVTEGSTAGVISSFTDDEITMVDNSGAVKAQPGPLSGSGSSFSVTWERSN